MKFCTNCGKQINDDAVFCRYCGAKGKAPAASKAPRPKPAPPPASEQKQRFAPSEPSVSKAGAAPEAANAARTAPLPEAGDSQPKTESEPKKAADRKKGRKAAVIAVCAVLGLAILGAGGWFGYRYISVRNQCAQLMKEAKSRLDDENYAAAADSCREILKLDGKNTDAALLLAEASLRQDRFDDAEEALGQLTLSEGNGQYEAYQRLLRVAALRPQLNEVDTENFPRLTVELSCGETAALTQDALRISENGEEYPVAEFRAENGKLLVSYEAPDSDVSEERRDVEVSILTDGFTFRRESSYKTPRFSQANVSLVSTDMSEYPTVKAYFRVEDAASGEAVEGLGPGSFIIRERVQGGEYVSREVHAVAALEGNRGLNIDLVADKSDSISYSDMDKIKRVMTEFVNSLHYEVGDKAEILAFDSIVQQMCYYTSDAALLVNGINNMSTDGATALYDAIHDGINHAALQGGARCVIAFTDGIDNRSRYYPSEVIDYAITCQVPVYIIGVSSSVETGTLRSIAEQTGGRYWFIDDLYDLSEIFDEIYSEQKKHYAVEYVSDASLDAYATREIDVGVSGSGYRAKDEISFRAAPTAEIGVHTSRYELFKEALTWEQAAQRCQEMGGHLATVASESEQEQLIAMAEAQEVDFLWLGGYTSYDDYGDVFGHWITGEEFNYAPWSVDEPSRVDRDGTEEWYIMLWNIPSLGGWSWNDQRNDPLSVAPNMADKMGFICEFEE